MVISSRNHFRWVIYRRLRVVFLKREEKTAATLMPAVGPFPGRLPCTGAGTGKFDQNIFGDVASGVCIGPPDLNMAWVVGFDEPPVRPPGRLFEDRQLIALLEGAAVPRLNAHEVLLLMFNSVLKTMCREHWYRFAEGTSSPKLLPNDPDPRTQTLISTSVQCQSHSEASMISS